MGKKISIPVEEFSIERFSGDDRLAKLSMKFMHDGENLNKSEIDLSVIKTAIANTLENTPTGVPILASFEDDGSDFKEHNDDEIVLGCVPPENNNVQYIEDETNNKTYVYADGYIWVYYSKNAVDILEEAKNNTKACSIEIEILKGHKDRKRGVYVISEFKFLGITLLGDKYLPGMEGAQVTLNYSLNNPEEYINKLKDLTDSLNLYFIKSKDVGTDDEMKIDLSKDSADMTGDWGSVDKTALRNTLMKKKNYKALVKACYLMVLDGYEDAPSKNLKYPVCKISNDTLILSAKGCEAALSELEKNTDDANYTKAKAKLKKYYKILGLSTENFSDDKINKNKKEDELMNFNKKEFALKFGLTTMQMANELYTVCSNAEKYIDEYWNCELCRYGLNDFDDTYVYCSDYKLGQTVRAPYSMKGDNPNVDFSKTERVKTQYVIWEGADDSDEDMPENYKKREQELKKNTMSIEDELKAKEKSLNEATEKFSKSEEKIAELEKELETSKSNFVEVTNKYSALENDVKGKDAEIETLKGEKEALNTFKLEKEKAEKVEKANAIFTENAELLSEEDIASFTNKLDEFDKFEDFEKEIKIFLYDKSKEKLNNINQSVNFSSIHNNKPNDNSQNDGLSRWAVYSKEYNK